MKTLLLLHGAVGSSQQLQPLQHALQTTYAVHTLNFPGHGGTPMPVAFSLPLFATYVKDYIHTNGLQDVALFGYSMGGYVAMLLALEQQAAITHIATLGTKFDWDEATAAKEIKMLQPELIEQKVPHFAQTLEQRHAPQNWKTVLQQTTHMITALGKENILKGETIPTITIPCLLMLGDRDKTVTLHETVEVYHRLPQAQLALLPNTPHPIENAPLPLLALLLQ